MASLTKAMGLAALVLYAAVLSAWTIVEHPADEEELKAWSAMSADEVLEIRSSGGGFRLVFCASSDDLAKTGLYLFGPDGYNQLSVWLDESYWLQILFPGEFEHKDSWVSLIHVDAEFGGLLKFECANREIGIWEGEFLYGPGRRVDYQRQLLEPEDGKLGGFYETIFQRRKWDEQVVPGEISDLTPELLQKLPVPSDREETTQETREIGSFRVTPVGKTELRLQARGGMTFVVQEFAWEKVLLSAFDRNRKLCSQILCSQNFVLNRMESYDVPNAAGRRLSRVGYWTQPPRFEHFIRETERETGEASEFGFLCPIVKSLQLKALTFQPAGGEK